MTGISTRSIRTSSIDHFWSFGTNGAVNLLSEAPFRYFEKFYANENELKYTSYVLVAIPRVLVANKKPNINKKPPTQTS